MKSLLILIFSGLVTLAQAAGVGDKAPDFTLNALDGGSYTLSALQGKVVYIFWFGYN